MPRHSCMLFAVLLFCSGARAQIVLQGVLLDATDRSPLVYASVATPGTTAITNLEGLFRIEVTLPSDTVVFSYLGYRTSKVSASQVIASHVVLLEPSVSTLAELSIEGRNDALPRAIVRAAERLERTGRYRSKVLYELSTHSRQQPVEAIECFYNGTVNGANIEELALKNGRIAVAPENGRYVMNLNTSRGFMLLHPTDRRSAFPATPLQYRSIKALRTHFDLTLVGIIGKDPEIHHIRFTPRIRDGSSFAGEIWLEPTDATIRRLELRCDTCTKHPFLPYDPQGELRDVSIHYALEWKGTGDRWLLDHIELDYALTFRDRADDPRPAMHSDPGDRRMSTQGVMHFFDHDRPFILPIFKYDEEQMDYRKVLALPFDSLFWQHAPALVRTQQQLRDLEFFSQHGELTGRKALDPNGRTGFFESNMAMWSPERRITLKSALRQGTSAPVRAAVPDIERVKLEAQLFLNIDEVSGGYRTFSATVLDGFRSHYDLPEQPYTACFLNLFFDLCEIERRKMQTQLDAPGLSLERIRSIHQEAVRNMERTTADFIRSTHIGTDPRQLREWNDRVQRALGIDNLLLFGSTE